MTTFAIDYIDSDWGDYRCIAIREVGAWRIVRGEDVVFRTKKPVTFVYDYPLNIECRRTHSATMDGKWTRNRVAKLVKKDYLYIYDHEDTFGVWGHNLSDLVIESCTYNSKNRTLRFGIGS